MSRPRLKQRLFVDVPPSLFPLSRYVPLSRKENAPLQTLLSRKRKLSDPDPSPSTKKQKLVAGTPSSIPAPLVSASNASADFPNGFIYCHQCSRKRDISAAIHCTVRETIISKDKSTTKEQRCKVKFCRSCLKNRYSEDLDVIIARKSTGKDKGHVNTEAYIFKCPKCRDICNCSRCRKSKGLEPTGVMRKAGAGSAIDKVPEKRQHKPKERATIGSAASMQGSPQNKTLRKAIPVLKWVEIPVKFDRKEAEARFGIREFMMRFACIMEPSIAKTHLMELEDISGECPEDDEEMAGWVSEACVRSIILGVLGLLAKQNDESLAQLIATAIKDIRTMGANLNKIWAILSRLRETANHDPQRGVHLSIPNPLPPPTSSAMHNTRNMRSTRDSNRAAYTQIVQSAQMIPVVEALIKNAIHTDAIREELDDGVKNGKDLTKRVKEYCRKENEKWEAERKALKASQKDDDVTKGYPRQMKIELEGQQRRLRHLEYALKLVLPGFAPRFTPLGTNSECVFYTLSPGIAERNAALDFITDMTTDPGETEGHVKRPRGAMRRQTAGGEERGAMNQWSWFVAVWGKEPVNGKRLPKTSEPHTDDKDSNDAEKWWAVYEPEEIRKVAEWVAVKSGINQSGLHDICSSLVKGLNDYAALLEWRLLENRFDAGNASEHHHHHQPVASK